MKCSARDVPTIDDFVRQGNTTLTALQVIVTKAGAIVDDVQNGKGTIGMLLEDPTIANRATSAITQADELIKTLRKVVDSNDNSVGKFLNDKGESLRADQFVDRQNQQA